MTTVIIINAINDDTMMTINDDTHSIEKRSSLISKRAQHLIGGLFQ